MRPTKLKSLKDSLIRIVCHEDGNSIIELAIIFPILLMLFVGTAELGRLFYTYTTLSKATDVGARYLSTSRNVVNGTAQQKIDEKVKAQNLVVCGVASISPTACDNVTPVVPGLRATNVTICDNFAVACNPVIPAGPTKYFRVEINGYNFTRGVWSLANLMGRASNTFYFALHPATQVRSMP